MRQNNKGRQERSRRRAYVAADLEDGLGESVPATGRHSSDARGLRMEYGGPGSDQRRRQEQERKISSPRQERKPGERESHSGGQ